MLGELLEDGPIFAGTPTIALVNGTGGTTMMELLTTYGNVAKQLAGLGIEAVSPMVGSHSTTQEMGGFSISLFTPTEQMLALWRAPHKAPHFPISARGEFESWPTNFMANKIHGVTIDAGSGLEATIRELRGDRTKADDLFYFKRAVLEMLGPDASTVLVDATCGPDLLLGYPENCAPMLAFEAYVYHISDADRITVLPNNFAVAQFHPF